jgi:hypothetical protein
MDRARALKSEGRLKLACQLAEWLVEAEADNPEAWELYGLLFKERAEAEFNMQARGAWNQAVRKAVAHLGRLGN